MESERDMYRQFQDWCLRTYGDSGKTKTVTRKKYERIVQLLNGSESSSTDNAKFKFWVKSKGFQLGQPDEVRAGGGGAKQVLYVPVKTTVSDCGRYQPGGEGWRRGCGENRGAEFPSGAPTPPVIAALSGQARSHPSWGSLCGSYYFFFLNQCCMQPDSGVLCPPGLSTLGPEAGACIPGSGDVLRPRAGLLSHVLRRAPGAKTPGLEPCRTL